MTLRTCRNADWRSFNLLTVKEMAMVFKNDEGESPFGIDIKVYPRNNINKLNPDLDRQA